MATHANPCSAATKWVVWMNPWLVTYFGFLVDLFMLSPRDTVGEGMHYCSGCRPPLSSVRSSGQILFPWYLMNGLSSLDETDREYSLGLAHTDDLIRFWKSKVNGQDHSRPSRWRRHLSTWTIGLRNLSTPCPKKRRHQTHGRNSVIS